MPRKTNLNDEKQRIMGHVDYCLIVDHDEERRNELKKTIAQSGWVKDVMAALNCGHGLLCLTQSVERLGGKQGVVILNGKTPIMGGFEFLQELHKGELRHEKDKLKIVIISDDLSVEEEKRYKAKGIMDFLPACCSDETFSVTLKNIFSKQTTVRRSKSGNDASADNQVYLIPGNNSRVG